MAIKAPEGTNDLLPEQARFWEQFKAKAYGVFSRYGYEPIETPYFEQTDLFVRGIGEATDVVSKEMFHVISGGNLEKLRQGEHIRSKSRLSLRPEGTAGVVRSVVEHDLVPQGSAPVKLMYAGPMFRAERPQKGRYRQFRQIGVECLGAEDPSVDAEAIIMLMRFYEEIGIPRKDMRLLLNSMGCPKCRPVYRDMVADFIHDHSENMCEECLNRAEINPLRAFDCKNETCAHVMEEAPRITGHLCEECSEHYKTVRAYLDAAGIEYIEDTTLVRGLDYYTRTVFEIQVDNGMGAQNAIGGGGRYDKLSEEIGGRPTCGLGFALGFERCALALEAAGVSVSGEKEAPVFFASVDNSVRAEVFNLTRGLRDFGISSDMDHQQRSLKSQFKLANKLGAQYVFVVGPDELAANELSLRDMNEHKDYRINLDALKKYMGSQSKVVYNEQTHIQSEHIMQDIINACVVTD